MAADSPMPPKTAVKPKPRLAPAVPKQRVYTPANVAKRTLKPQ